MRIDIYKRMRLISHIFQIQIKLFIYHSIFLNSLFIIQKNNTIHLNKIASAFILDYFSLNLLRFCNLSPPPTLVKSTIGFIMLKMIDVLEHNLVQNFKYAITSPTTNFDEQLNQGILNASELQLHNVLASFLLQHNPLEIAYALDISPERIQAIQSGAALSHENLNDTVKVVALCLALETDTLANVNIADSLQDYPI